MYWRAVRVRRKKFPNFCRTLLTVNISEMADKEKRLRKILSKNGLKGKLKLVATLEEAHLVIIKIGLGTPRITRKEEYIAMLEDGYTFSEEEVYFVVSSNPRDSKHIERKYLTNTLSNTKNLNIYSPNHE